MIFHKNVSVPPKWNGGVLRVNVYQPIVEGKYPSLVSYGPIWKGYLLWRESNSYEAFQCSPRCHSKGFFHFSFHEKPFSEVNPVHKSKYSAWETPDPVYWTKSPGLLDTMSASTANSFFDLIEWTAVQDWCNGKVGLLGVSYYAGKLIQDRGATSFNLSNLYPFRKPMTCCSKAP